MLGVYADSFLTAARVAPRRRPSFPEPPEGAVVKKKSAVARALSHFSRKARA
ncbi:hypothetical protein TRL7639_00300 [Falsiruegeria litorea R37]|uniref:Uncharacterized protein n=1 Tax=Falsiruegeria litorea R37 TaxID=1200284 RepID=A0A1Y5RH67_9RHOB|nr:hypothetical protein [Falsiruegeria litorea]SLN16217.1 hypothetical protein TRL7639_00300 [Falsiruegeria litorea R37]